MTTFERGIDGGALTGNATPPKLRRLGLRTRPSADLQSRTQRGVDDGSAHEPRRAEDEYVIWCHSCWW